MTEQAKDIKAPIDWELIEKHYRAGLLPLRSIAAESGRVTEGGIRKRARRDGWTRAQVTRLERPVRRKVGIQPPEPVRLPVDEMAAAGFLYVIYIETGLERLYKIGMSKNFLGRIDSHQCSSPFQVMVAMCYYCGQMRQEEAILHAAFADKRVRGEWFRLNPEDLEEISRRTVLV